MKKIFYITVILSQAFISTSYCGPMESHKNYNVILVHGAGGHKYGMDCVDSIYYEASRYIVKDDYLTLTGGYGGKKLGLSSKFPFVLKERESSAEDMDMDNDGLRHWLTEDILEDKEKKTVYLQRPFTNPANSPVNNARELGDPKWEGDKNCSVRRSLIEEAQEVRANRADSSEHGDTFLLRCCI